MILAIDQYNTKLILKGEAPRKELLEKLSASSAEKMYVDGKDGNAKHIGYIVDNCWFTFYTITPWEGK